MARFHPRISLTKGKPVLPPLILYAYCGLHFLRGMVQEIKKRQPGMMTLISRTIPVAFFFSTATVFFIVGRAFFRELATLIDLMLLGHWMEMKSVLGASRALKELVKVMPTTAHLVKNGRVEDVPVSQLQPTNVVLIRPSEKFLSDGVVVEGKSSVNESLLTGRSKLIHMETDDKVVGGAIDEEGVLKVRIEKTGEETYLAQVINLVRQTQMQIKNPGLGKQGSYAPLLHRHHRGNTNLCYMVPCWKS
jgi:Cu2+-exporting ATPase